MLETKTRPKTVFMGFDFSCIKEEPEPSDFQEFSPSSNEEEFEVGRVKSGSISSPDDRCLEFERKEINVEVIQIGEDFDQSLEL